MHISQQTATKAASCPFAHTLADNPAHRSLNGLPGRQIREQAVVEDVRSWMSRKLPCVAGRRELSRGRYVVRYATRETVPAIFADYKRQLAAGNAVACLMVFADERYCGEDADATTVFRFLAEQIEVLGNVPAETLANGGALTHRIELRCPVTGKKTLFDDFECIAFCPQSADKTDPLYDPLMSAPYPCVNISSDVYGFSRFVDDSAIVALGHHVHEEKDMGRIESFLALCVERWQRFAKATIGNFEAITDTRICPVHVTADEKHWVAAHKDPAFAETSKESHLHELPVLYATRIAARWLAHFKGESEYDAGGLARDGLRM